jgi:TRAP-type C4-dicarboxylate transport system substrate-binding protein
LNIGPAHYLNIRRYTMRRKVLLLLVAVLLLLGAYVPTYAAEAIKLKFANFFPPVHKNAVIFDQFSQEINKKSNGKVEISYYPGGTLLTAPKIAAGVATGIADIGLSHCAYSRGRFPVMEAMELPLGFPSGYIGSHAANDFYDKFKPKEWEQFQPLVFGFSPPAIMQTVAKPVRTLEDLKGLKIRGTGRIGDIVKALGATPMPLEMVDLYESLRRGVIDGNFGPLEQLKGFKTGEIIKYASASWRVGAAYTFYVAMNKRKWDSHRGRGVPEEPGRPDCTHQRHRSQSMGQGCRTGYRRIQEGLSRQRLQGQRSRWLDRLPEGAYRVLEGSGKSEQDPDSISVLAGFLQGRGIISSRGGQLAAPCCMKNAYFFCQYFHTSD